MRAPAKALPLFASAVGVLAPLVAVSGLVPPMAGPVLLALGMVAALALARSGSRGRR